MVENNREGEILAAAWNADTCSLAIATAAGGVKIYRISPTPRTFGAGEIRDRSHAIDAPASRPQTPDTQPPASALLRHEIVLKSVSPPPVGGDRGGGGGGGSGSRLFSQAQVHSLATDNVSSLEGGRAAGAGILLGLADGQHLCVWDIATGSTLLTALAIAQEGCKVEKVMWYGPTALTALLYAMDGGLRRVDVHQVNVAKNTTTPVRGWGLGGGRGGEGG